MEIRREVCPETGLQLVRLRYLASIIDPARLFPAVCDVEIDYSTMIIAVSAILQKKNEGEKFPGDDRWLSLFWGLLRSSQLHWLHLRSVNRAFFFTANCCTFVWKYPAQPDLFIQLDCCAIIGIWDNRRWRLYNSSRRICDAIMRVSCRRADRFMTNCTRTSSLSVSHHSFPTPLDFVDSHFRK